MLVYRRVDPTGTSPDAVTVNEAALPVDLLERIKEENRVCDERKAEAEHLKRVFRLFVHSEVRDCVPVGLAAHEASPRRVLSTRWSSSGHCCRHRRWQCAQRRLA
jgi:hypothetical protein